MTGWQRTTVRVQLALLVYLQLCAWLPITAWNGQHDFDVPDVMYLAMGVLQALFAFGFARWNRWLVGIGLVGYLAWLYLQIDGWWIPYVAGYSPGGRAFYAKYFAETWKPLPSWGDHLAPDAMHVILQVLIVAAIATALLAIYGRTKMSLGSTSPTPTPNSGTKSVPRVARPW
jgi:hypothetical protein